MLGCLNCGERIISPWPGRTKKTKRPNVRLNKDLIKKLTGLDKTIPEIAKETGYNMFSVGTLIKRLGLKCKLGVRGKGKKFNNEPINV